MSSFALTTTGIWANIPVIGSPTVVLMRHLESRMKASRTFFQKEIPPRVVIIMAVSTAVLEAFTHMLMSVGTCAGLSGRVLVRITNRVLAGAIGASWSFVYGGVASFSPTVWLRRIVIYGYLLSRDVTVVWRHFLERFVAAGDYAWLGVRLWDLSGRVDTVLEGYFNVKRASHHAGQSWEFLSFAISNVAMGLYNPSQAVRSCKKQRLGSPVPLPSLSSRVMHVAWKNKSITLLVAAALALAADCFLISKKESFHVYCGQVFPNRIVTFRDTFYSFTFGQLYTIANLLSEATRWIDDSRKRMKTQGDLDELKMVEKCYELKKMGFHCPPDVLPPEIIEKYRPKSES